MAICLPPKPYRTWYEVEIAKVNKDLRYEPKDSVLEWTSKILHKYTPDFVLPNGVLVEAKGWFRPKEQEKYLSLKANYKELDLRFLFQKPHQKLPRAKRMTYAKWADKHKFIWAEGPYIPKEWYATEDKNDEVPWQYEG